VNDSNIPWVIAVLIGSILSNTLEDSIREIILTLKLEMLNILIPVICGDPFFSNEFKYVVSIIAGQWIRCTL